MMVSELNKSLRTFLYMIVKVGIFLFLGLVVGGWTIVHAYQAAPSSNLVFLPLVFRSPVYQTLTVNVINTGNGTVTSNPPGINCVSTCFYAFPYNSVVTLQASPTPPYTFSGWNGSGCSGLDPCVVTMDTAKSVTATFTLGSFQLRIGVTGSGSGTVTSSPPGIDCGSTCFYSFASNTVVTLTATPDPGFVFAGWSEGDCSGKGTCVITMNADKQILATFNIPEIPCIGLINCDFESGSGVGWTEYSSHGYPIIYDCSDPLICNDVHAHSGNWLAWLGGEVSEISYIQQQQVAITSNAPYLVYWQWIDSPDICGYDHDYVEVLINGVRVDKYDLCIGTSTLEWVPHNLNLSTYAGQSITLQIRSTTDANGYYSNLYIDDVSLLAGPIVLEANPGIAPNRYGDPGKN
jgi:hypothetical protein